MDKRIFYVYILASKRNGTLYTGVTNSLIKRVDQHKNGYYPNSFTSKYKINLLVYYENYKYVLNCIQREKQIKKYSRQKKEALINSINPHWNDLHNELF